MITLTQIDKNFHSIVVDDGGASLTIDNATLTSLANTISGNELQVDIVSAPTLTVQATDLDIRDLTSASDSVEIKTAAGQALAIDGSGFITANVNGTVTVSSTNLDIRDLTHASDSVKVGDGTDFLAVNTDGSINVNSSSSGLATWQTSAATATTTASQLAATPLTDRVRMIIQNLGSQDAYLGASNAVTSSTGILLPKGTSFEFDFDDAADIWVITASGSASIRIAEYAI